ncbi:MAG TPA: hypothetical protein VFZ04_15580 [Longimicrobiales bacterium]
MKTLTVVTSVATALSIGCAAATGPQSIPEDVQFDRIRNAYVDMETMPTQSALLQDLPRTLAKHGYFIIRTEPGMGEGYRFLTDWQVRPVYAEEAFAGVQEARTRLVVDARRRGTGYAVSIYAVSFLEDETGSWRPAVASSAIRKQLRDISTQFALDVR